MVWLNEDETGPAPGTQICRAGTEFLIDTPVNNLDKLCKFCIRNGKCKASELYKKQKINKNLDEWSE